MGKAMKNTKDILLKMLESNRGDYLSGEAMANELGITRAAVWKAISELRKDGHDIVSKTGFGYVLSEKSDLLSAPGMIPFLNGPATNPENLYVYDELVSTNQTAKQLGAENAVSGTLVVADHQTKGRGRLGRTFFSPKGSGLYMSIIIRPDSKPNQAVLTTTATAVAVLRAIKTWANIDVKIKWVNDLFYKKRKIAGILVEATTDIQTRRVDYLVIGIGINVEGKSADFPKEIESIAGALFENDNHPQRNKLCALIYNNVMELTINPDPEDYMDEYKENCFILNKPVDVIKQSQETITVIARDIDNQGGLIAETKDGKTFTLNSGEVSLRPLSYE